ncbi:MAG: EF-P lysine aminoacylase EpmA [Thiolinea sp.]
MKRLLAAGSGDIYQICKVWRREESGSRHNPEFTLLEYYRVGFSYQRLMQETAELLQQLLPQLNRPPQFIAYRDCFLERLQLDPHLADKDALQAAARAENLEVQGELTRQEWLDLLFTHVIEADFAQDRLSFVYHYPAEQAALAATCSDEHGHPVAQRFEVYLGRMELGNGYQELTDGAQNAARLQQEQAQRLAAHQDAIPVDRHFLAALQRGLPRCAGIALGVDRILLCRLGKKALNQVISFDWELA